MTSFSFKFYIMRVLKLVYKLQKVKKLWSSNNLEKVTQCNIQSDGRE